MAIKDYRIILKTLTLGLVADADPRRRGTTVRAGLERYLATVTRAALGVKNATPQTPFWVDGGLATPTGPRDVKPMTSVGGTSTMKARGNSSS